MKAIVLVAVALAIGIALGVIKLGAWCAIWCWENSLGDCT